MKALNDTIDFSNIRSGKEFAQRVFTPEYFIKEVEEPNQEFFSAYNSETVDYVYGMFALNNLHNWGNFYDGKSNRDEPNLEEILEGARALRSLIGNRQLSTDVEGDYGMWASPWSCHVDTPEEYVAIVAGFQLETDERTIDYEEHPERIDDVIGLCNQLINELKLPKEDVVSAFDEIACIEVDDPDYDYITPEQVAKLKDYRDSL